MRSDRAWAVSLGVLLVMVLALALSLRLPGVPDWCVRAAGLGTLAGLGALAFFTVILFLDKKV